MSSPIAKENKGFFDKLLIAFHKRVSHSKRVNQLSELFAKELKILQKKDEVISLLDVGCGDMSIAKSIETKVDKLQFKSIDIYPNSEGWENYEEFDGLNIPFGGKEFDVALFSDVLHHDYKNIAILLKEAIRVADYIIIKDHFEYGIWSRNILKLADFIGNYGYGVSIPKKYLSKEVYYRLLQQCQLEEIKLICPIQLYGKAFLSRALFKGKYQFISVLINSIKDAEF